MSRVHGSRVIAALAGAAALMLTMAACTSDSAPSGSSSGGDSGADLTKVTVGAVMNSAAVPLWVAQEQGIFEKHGLDVELVDSPNFAASTPALLNGQYHFANAATGPVLTAVSEGVPLQIVGGVQAEHDDPTIGDDQVMVPADSDIKRPKDLEGKTVATSAIGAGPYIGVMANYLADGGTPEGINWVVMNFNEQIPALENGQVDAIVASEPFRASAEESGFIQAFNAYIVPGLDTMPTGFNDAVVVATDDYVTENPEIAEAMRAALIEAGEWAEANTDAVRALLVEKVGMDAETVENVHLPAFIGEIDPQGIQAMADAMQEIGLISEAPVAENIVWVP